MTTKKLQKLVGHLHMKNLRLQHEFSAARKPVNAEADSD